MAGGKPRYRSFQDISSDAEGSLALFDELNVCDRRIATRVNFICLSSNVFPLLLPSTLAVSVELLRAVGHGDVVRFQVR